jgi:RNA polymerase sigma-70 factor (ECF subfamily)
MTRVEASVPLSLQSARPRDDARLRAAVVAHYDTLWHALYRFGVPRQSVEDAAQQVLLVFSQRLDDVAIGSERAFLYGTAIRTASDYRKMQSRSREVLDEPAVASKRASAPDPEELLDARRMRELLDDGLAELPMDLRAVFVLFEFEGMTMIEIAETLGVPPGTVASRLRRAREAFQTIVENLRSRLGVTA